MTNRLLLLCAAMTAATLSHAQFFDSLEVKAGLQARLSSASYQPLWLKANKYGTVADRQNDLSPYVRIKGKYVIAEPEYQNDRGFYDYNEVALLYGVSIYNNDHFGNTLLEEGYLKLEYKNWSLRAGRFEETSGGIDPELSMGSLGISSNALPIPKVGIAVKDYTAVPFTGRWLQFKGSFAHGWMGDQRYIKDSYYHEKTLFLRFGLRKLKLYAGIEHFAEWGGKRGDQQWDRSMKGFWDAVLAKDEGDANGSSEEGGHHGDQRGVIQGGFYWENDNVKFHGYMQKPFEGRNDLSLRNKNMLSGIAVEFKNKYLGLQKIVAEFISTKGINRHIVATRRESLYNNSVFKTGWEYQDNVIGTPLLMNRYRANKYFPEITPYNWNGPDTIPGNSNIINNSVTGFHTGATYYISESLGGKTLLTYTSNGGTETSHALFTPARKQVYGLQQFSYDISNLTLTAGVGFEFGELSNKMVAGLLLGVEWNITGNRNAY